MDHLALCPQCGICTDIIFKHERVIALYGNGDSTSYRGHTRPFLFPDLGPTITRVDGFLLCRYPNCDKCTDSPHFIPMHYECLEIFLQCCIESIDALDRLWTVASWRSPWRRARPIYLFSGQPDPKSLEALAQTCQLQQLYKLPLELLDIIQHYSEHALLWRAISAHTLAARISSTSPEPLTIMSLRTIRFWERGGKPARHSNVSSSMSVMRFTIDSHGISKIERISSDQPSQDVSHRGRFAYIVEREQTIAEFTAQLKDGLLRLVLPGGQPTLRIWNTPDPPNLSLCTLYTSAYTPWQRFFAVDTSCITGITFFFSVGRLFGIHPHYTPTDAMPTYRRFSHTRKRAIVWVYHPFAKNDRLLVVGLREGSHRRLSVLIRSERTGDTVIGSYILGSAETLCLGWCPPITLIYNDPIEGDEVSFLGADCGSRKMELPKPFVMRRLGFNPLGERSYHSSAPLANVASAEVFYDESDQFCRGIVFRYHNGACRAVGQCRVHVDAAKRVSCPRYFCYRISTSNHRYQVQVNLALQQSPHQHRGAEWSCRRLDGILNFWFDPDSSFITIEN